MTCILPFAFFIPWMKFVVGDTGQTFWWREDGWLVPLGVFITILMFPFSAYLIYKLGFLK